MIIKIPDYTYFHIKKYKEDALDRSIILEAIRKGKIVHKLETYALDRMIQEDDNV